MKRRTRNVMLGMAAAAAGAAAAIALERSVLHHALSRPDLEAGQPLHQRPERLRFVPSFDGTSLAVHETEPDVPPPPEAPTLLFVHGFSQDTTGWHFQQREFGRSHRCVFFDQRGHGLSAPAGSGGYTLPALGRDLRAVLDAAVPSSPAALIGHSMGGMSILALAEQHPDEFGARVRAAVLADTVASDIIPSLSGALAGRVGQRTLPRASTMAAQAERAFRLRHRVLRDGEGDLAFLIARATNFTPEVSPSLVRHVLRVASQVRPEVWTDLFASIVQMDLSHAIRHVTVPTLVVVGEHDRLTPPSAALRLSQQLPDATLVILKDAGHYSMLEHHEAFNEAVRSFLDQAFPQLERVPA